MECNKDDALKAAELAEKKYMQQDFVAARKFCNKALQLYPSLERAKQMLAVVEVHAAAHHSHIGLEDWYAVLQVDPCADEATIRKQYRKMALMLHPDKNRVVGAEPAFKIINEAWMVLSDKNKKIMYDVKRSTRIKKPENGRYATEQPSCSTQPEAPATTAPATAPDPPPSPPPPPPPPSANTQQTFWTQCPNCKIQYQYYRKFENYQLLCHRCQTGFIATDIGTPPVETSTWPAKAAKKKTTNGANGVNGESSAFQQMQQRAREREEKRREEERKKAEREREREEKRRLKEALKKAKEEDRRRELLEKQLTKLREKEEKEARKKNMEALRKKLKKSRVEEEDDDDDDDDEDEESDEARIAEESPASPEDDNVEEESHFLVPDPDFYNFDTDRKESYVREGQVWALYDDTDGMPRFYCEIKQLVSLNPFKVRLRWLERYVISDEADEWEAAGFTVTCGQFKCKRKTETEAHFNKFSHLMQVDRIHANVVSVYPKQGEIWAVYKDWSLKLRPDKVSYDMVEVVSSYVEAAGLTAVSLIKVEGYKTIFARGAGSLRSFRSKDLLRFSHKVPAHWMIGTEKLNAPHSCWELDTAATPSHLIFVNR
ncbi:hypothetical protein SELMODRAFT_124892 [Selaginella moellendorffii]|uniref:J domain-containing protein n=1 Tax=Selaginella moellendorffii TaxID=88036 RepID=D8SUB2_SELML|nr:hypothetical protein SELMODRAFT_124892 [Selaginella moellendorffii]